MAEVYTVREQCERRLAGLKAERKSWEARWLDLDRYMYPGGSRLSREDTNRGYRKDLDILDNTGVLARRTLASGLHSGMNSPARPWFRFGTDDPDLNEFHSMKVWLSVFEERARTILGAGNLYNTIHADNGQLGTFGNGAIWLDDDYEDVIRGYGLVCGEYWLSQNERGVVDTISRELMMTVRQTIAKFGLDNVSQTVRTSYDQSNYDTLVPVTQVVEPNPEFIPGRRLGPGAKAWRSVWWEPGAPDKTNLALGYYSWFPVIAPRWDVIGLDVYGQAPAYDTLGDDKGLQLMELRALEALDKAVNPPLQGPTALRNSAVDLVPGSITYVDVATPQMGLRPIYEVQPRLDLLEAKQAQIRQRINQGLYVDLFLLLHQSELSGNTTEKTAYEVAQRHQERLLMLGPVIERLHNERADRLLSALAARMIALRLVPPPPPEMRGRSIQIEYISALAQAQRAVGTASIERLAGFVGNLAAVNVAVLDKFDADEAVDQYAEAVGASPRIVVPDETVARVRQARAQQESAANALAGAESAAKSAQVLSQTDTRTDNALTRILGLAA